MAAARFPIHRSLADFDFSQSKADEPLIQQLATFDFTDAAHNVVLVGGTGTGKMHLAAALGVAAIQQHGLRVRFYSTVDLVNMPEQENAAGRQGRLILSLIHMDLVILDALGVFVVRAFVRLKQTLDSHQALARRIAQLEARTDARFKAVFDALRNLMTSAEPKRRPIGFVYPKEK